MIPKNKHNCALRGRGNALRSFTLIEAVISTVIVGIMFVAAMNVLGATAVSKRSTEQQALGYSLAQDLMNEILNQPYEDPTQTATFGRETGESGSDRADFDDVDDYVNWSAIPPEDKNGEPLIGYDQWTRSVDVDYVKPTDLKQIGATTGVKRIVVTVSRDGIAATEIIAIRTKAWPIGRKDPGIVVLFVVSSKSTPTIQESAKKLLMKSWGFDVTLINASDSQAKYDAAVVDTNVAYISEDIDDADLNTKLRYTSIGVVNEEANLGSEFGFAAFWTSVNSSDIKIVDNSHYITSGLSIGTIPILNSSQPGHMLVGSIAGGLQTLGRSWDTSSNGYRPSLAVIETLDDLYGGESATGRRVRLPWGRLDFDISQLNKNGREIMKRSIEWAASKEQP